MSLISLLTQWQCFILRKLNTLKGYPSSPYYVFTFPVSCFPRALTTTEDNVTWYKPISFFSPPSHSWWATGINTKMKHHKYCECLPLATLPILLIVFELQCQNHCLNLQWNSNFKFPQRQKKQNVQSPKLYKKNWKRPIKRHFQFFVQFETYINVLLNVNVDARWQSPGKVIRRGQTLILNNGWWFTQWLTLWPIEQPPAKKYNWRRWLLWTGHKVHVETNKGNWDLEFDNR